MRPKGLLNVLLPVMLVFFMIAASPHAVQDTAEAADEEIRWKVPAHWPSSSASFSGSLERVAELVEERSDGRLI
ncbi:MAG: hypothetical protein ACLFUN_10535, partial [Desulfobacterales bacterium]